MRGGDEPNIEELVIDVNGEVLGIRLVGGRDSFPGVGRRSPARGFLLACVSVPQWTNGFWSFQTR